MKNQYFWPEKWYIDIFTAAFTYKIVYQGDKIRVEIEYSLWQCNIGEVKMEKCKKLWWSKIRWVFSHSHMSSYSWHISTSLPGPQQGHSNSQRRCRGNAGQLRPGLLAHEVLHRTFERLQKCGLGVRQQQEGPAEGHVPAGHGRGHRLCPPYLNRCVKMVFVKTLKLGHNERTISHLPLLNLTGMLVWCVHWPACVSGNGW